MTSKLRATKSGTASTNSCLGRKEPGRAGQSTQAAGEAAAEPTETAAPAAAEARATAQVAADEGAQGAAAGAPSPPPPAEFDGDDPSSSVLFGGGAAAQGKFSGSADFPQLAREMLTKSGGKGGALVLWKPLPPTPDFVALGMVATAHAADAREPRPPAFDAVRCVPKAWARKATGPEAVWQGTAGTVWRTRHNLVYAAKGRHPPPMWELPRDQFSSESPNPPAVPGGGA